MKIKLLKQANKIKEKRNKITSKDYDLPMEGGFLTKIYHICTPNVRGNMITKKIIKDMQHKVSITKVSTKNELHLGNLREISPRLNRGDIHIDYRLFFEVKSSFTSMKNTYSITNIRSWQKLDFYVLCLVDTNDNFKPHFFCIKPKALYDNPHIHLGDMNNSKKINEENEYVGKRTTIPSDNIMWLFKKHNELNGTTYKHLLSFLKLKNPKNI